MKRLLVQLAALGFLLIPCPTLGQLGDDQADPQKTQEATAGDNSEGSQRETTTELSDRYGHAETKSRKLAVKLTRLRFTMKKQLKLTQQQTETVDRLFDEYVKVLRDSRRNSSEQAAFSNKDNPETATLRAEVRRAKEAGDREALLQAKRTLNEKLRASGKLKPGHRVQFLRAVSDELTTKQRPKFQMMVMRLKIGPRKSPRQNPLRGFARIVSSSKLGLTSEQRRKVQVRLRNAFRDIAGAAADPRRVDEVFARARADIMSQLTPQQQVKFEALLKARNRPPRPQNLSEERVPADKILSEDE